MRPKADRIDGGVLGVGKGRIIDEDGQVFMRQVVSYFRLILVVAESILRQDEVSMFPVRNHMAWAGGGQQAGKPVTKTSNLGK